MYVSFSAKKTQVYIPDLTTMPVPTSLHFYFPLSLSPNTNPQHRIFNYSSIMSFQKQVDLSDTLQGLSTEKINFHPPTGISVLVVGAGVGGLMAALECRRKGHDVRVVEKSPTPSTQGISAPEEVMLRA